MGKSTVRLERVHFIKEGFICCFLYLHICSVFRKIAEEFKHETVLAVFPEKWNCATCHVIVRDGVERRKYEN